MRRTLDLLDTADLTSGGEAVVQCLSGKELVAHIPDQRLGLREAVQEKNTGQARRCQTHDYAQGTGAFQEKREPRFPG